MNERADQTTDDHRQIEKDRGDDIGQGQAGAEEKLEEEHRGGDHPVDIPHVPDRSCREAVGQIGVCETSSDKLWNDRG